MSRHALADQELPDPQKGVRGYLGRPVWNELRSVRELRALKRSPLFNGVGFPVGEGEPVLVIPGFLAGPASAHAVEHVLRVAGWDVMQAPVGRNAGPAYTGIDAATGALRQLSNGGQRKVRIVGHSRGGQFARILAVRYPELVSQVIGLGVPFRTKYPNYAVVKIPAELLDRVWRLGVFGPVDTHAEDVADEDRLIVFPPGIDLVSIYSKSDGIVDWRTSFDPAATLVSVRSSHAGLINSIPGVTAIGEALSRI